MWALTICYRHTVRCTGFTVMLDLLSSSVIGAAGIYLDYFTHFENEHISGANCPLFHIPSSLNFYFHSSMHAISFFFFIYILSFYPVLPCPPAARPYHLPLNECAAGSFVNNRCHQNTKERAKPFTPLQKDFGQGNYWEKIGVRLKAIAGKMEIWM